MGTKEKGAKRKHANREFMAKRTEEKLKERGGSPASSKNATRHSSTAVPVDKMPQMPSKVLRVIVDNREPGWEAAERVLNQRQAAQQRNQPSPQASASPG